MPQEDTYMLDPPETPVSPPDRVAHDTCGGCQISPITKAAQNSTNTARWLFESQCRCQSGLEMDEEQGEGMVRPIYSQVLS